MALKHTVMNVATAFLKGVLGLAGATRSRMIRAHLAEQLTPIAEQQTDAGVIRFWCHGKLPEWRARTLLTKEPETIRWIDGFSPGDTFWDIGANVGVYSLYAAKRGARVLSFEPSPGNYYLLSRNIEINALDEAIAAYCIAFASASGLDTFYMSNTDDWRRAQQLRRSHRLARQRLRRAVPSGHDGFYGGCVCETV